jgi:hypothetical protein
VNCQEDWSFAELPAWQYPRQESGKLAVSFRVATTTGFYQPRSALPLGRRALLLLPRENRAGEQWERFFVKCFLGVFFRLFDPLRKSLFVHNSLIIGCRELISSGLQSGFQRHLSAYPRIYAKGVKALASMVLGSALAGMTESS